jgi:hypothetical protein
MEVPLMDEERISERSQGRLRAAIVASFSARGERPNLPAIEHARPGFAHNRHVTGSPVGVLAVAFG